MKFQKEQRTYKQGNAPMYSVKQFLTRFYGSLALTAALCVAILVSV